MVLSAIRFLGSLKLTVGLLCALAVGLSLHALNLLVSESLRIGLLSAICVNLLVFATLHGRRLFFRRPAFALFHASFLTILALGLLDRLTFCKASVAVAEGQVVSIPEMSSKRGIWAPDWLNDISLRVDRVGTRFWRGKDVSEKAATVALLAGPREVFRGEISPPRAAEYRGLQVSIASSEGFAAVFAYSVPGEAPQTGFVLFPDYVEKHDAQSTLFGVPGHADLVCRLEMKSILRKDEPWELAPDASARVIVTGRDGGANRLKPGDFIRMDGGRLELLDFRRYSLFIVHYDPFVPWILGISILLPVFITWHYWQKWRG